MRSSLNILVSACLILACLGQSSASNALLCFEDPKSTDDSTEKSSEGGYIDRHPICTAIGVVGMVASGVAFYRALKAGAFDPNTISRWWRTPDLPLMPHELDQILPGWQVAEFGPNTFLNPVSIQLPNAMNAILIDRTIIPASMTENLVLRKTADGSVYAIVATSIPDRFLALKVSATIDEPIYHPRSFLGYGKALTNEALVALTPKDVILRVVGVDEALAASAE